MLATFLHDLFQTSCVHVQHVGPQVMTCWTNKLLSVVVVVKLVTSEDFKLLRINQASYQIFSVITVRILRALYLGCLLLLVSSYCCDLIGKSNLVVSSFGCCKLELISCSPET